MPAETSSDTDALILWALNNLGGEAGRAMKPADYRIETAPRAKPNSNEFELQVRLLEAKNGILERMAKGANLERSLEHIALAVEGFIPDVMCSISILDLDSNRLRHVASSKRGHGLESILDDVEISPRSVPCGIAAFRREPVVVSECAAGSLCTSYDEACAASGFLSCSAQPILDQNGEVLGVLSLFNSSTQDTAERDLKIVDAMSPLARIAMEHHRRAHALQSVNERLVSLGESMPGVVYQRRVSTDGDIRYTYISEGARELFGVSPAEIMDNPNALFDCHGPEYSATFRERLLAASRSLTMWDVEASIITRDGQHKWTHAIARPTRQLDGSVLWDGIILDATRIKEASLELAASNRAKTEFLANMSHELRTPLNAIIGFAELMLDNKMTRAESPQPADFIGDIHESGMHLLDIINDILDISKIETGTLELREESLEPCEIIDQCVRLIGDRPAAADITISVEAPDHVPRLRADQQKLKQILINLLSNAVKFNSQGGKVTVTLEVEDNGGISISVADTGIGISPENIAKVFEPFVQVDSSLDRSFEGTGLGLPLTKAMVELHGGSIDLQSLEGEGTTVRICFPPEKIID